MSERMTVDKKAYNQALAALQMLSGEVSFAKVLPIVNAFQRSIVQEPKSLADKLRESDDVYAEKAKEQMDKFDEFAEKLEKDAEKCRSSSPQSS